MIKCKNSCPLERFDGCCFCCDVFNSGFPDGTQCADKCNNEDPQKCDDAIYTGTDLEIFQDKAAAVIKAISDLVKQKAAIEEAEKKMREQLQAAMEAHGIKQFDNDVIKVTFVEASTRTTIDSTKLKAQQPEIYAKFSKTSDVKPFVKITLKGAKEDG